MNQSNFPKALVISIIVLIVYSFFAFMGLLYWRPSEEASISVGWAAFGAVIYCGIATALVYLLRQSKASRFDVIYKGGQYLFGFLLLVWMVGGAIPFSHFTNMLERKDEIRNSFVTAAGSLQEMDSKYDRYVADCLAKYRDALNSADDQSALLSWTAGYSHQERVDNAVFAYECDIKVLRTDSVQIQRWTDELKDFSLWNPQTISNLDVLKNALDNRTTDYEALANKLPPGGWNPPALTLSGEDGKTGKQEIQEVVNMMTELKMPPSWISLISAVICWLLIIVVYYITQRDLAGYTGGRNHDGYNAPPM
ncbi:MAG: hypothetical protein IJU62_07480 [Muribaculaceae bacterium]|nr:hypothetical protein [Muribaculaceae bacterium]